MTTGFNERPCYVEGSEGPLFAITTQPPVGSSNVVLCPGGWHGGSIQANRLVMRMAAALAETGHNVVRFDWRGSGESPGHIRFFNLAEPFASDAMTAAHLLPPGLPTSLVGFCFGARSALAAAPAIDGLEAVVLLSFPFPAGRTKEKSASRVTATAAIREGLRPAALKGWLDPATRRVYVKFLKLRWQQLWRRLRPAAAAPATPDMIRREEAQAIALEDLLAQLAELIRRRVRILMVFGNDDIMYQHWQAAEEAELGELMASSDGLVDVMTVSGELHGFSSLQSQEGVIAAISGWLTGRAVPASD